MHSSARFTDILHENYPLSRQPLASSHIRLVYYITHTPVLQVFFYLRFVDFSSLCLPFSVHFIQKWGVLPFLGLLKGLFFGAAQKLFRFLLCLREKPTIFLSYLQKMGILTKFEMPIVLRFFSAIIYKGGSATREEGLF